MTRIASLNPKRWHVFGVGLLACVLAGGAFAIAASPNSQLASGSLRLSSTASSDPIDITGTDTPDSLKRVLRTAINVPSGKTADVQATFSASLHHQSGTYSYCFGRFTLDSHTSDSNFKPGSVQLLGGETATQPNAVGVAMTGYRKSIGPGSHYVNVYISSAYAGCELQERALNVIVNLH